MNDVTIIYYTDNRLDEPLNTACQRHLAELSERIDVPVISVSHIPIKLGHNIAIGKKKRGWKSVYRQLYIGVENAKTKYIATAEHDCFYTEEHFKYSHIDDGAFNYNSNHWFVQFSEKRHSDLNGMYSRFRGERLALSQLICRRDLLLSVINTRFEMLSNDYSPVRKYVFAGEPGLSKLRIYSNKKRFGEFEALPENIKNQLNNEKYSSFKTKLPNLDVRHDNNLTGPKRGGERRWDLSPWGNFKEMVDKYGRNKKQK